MSDDTYRHDDVWEGTRSEGPGSRIGPFLLTRRIGEGGFGDVYEAEQERPVRRKVAMKIIKLGMDTREVISRFAMEREALALMEHPHIARVLDAGATDSGRPYFVMELVDGEPITDYCDNLALPIEARLRLFEQVCAAVQHAHTKGVIHRDLKPGNVLVHTQDGKPYAKVIDFGIAKATGGDLIERTRATRMDQVMGTPLYMSPEQARGSADIDTRSDIYALGVILYELLTGSTPVERSRLLSVSLADTQRLICETEPPVPSARLMKIATSAATLTAGFHANDPRTLARRIRGELDWIVMKSLEKDPGRRYETASAFAADVHRYLKGEHVLAAPPNLAYRVRKFVRRNKGPVAAAALVALALLIGLVGFAWQAQVARAQERLALQRAEQIQRVVTFQDEMLLQVDPTEAGKSLTDDVGKHFEAALKDDKSVPDAARAGVMADFRKQWERINDTDIASGVIARSILQPSEKAIDKQFGDQPEIAAGLQHNLARHYEEMGRYDESLRVMTKALATRRRVLGEQDPDTLTSAFWVASTMEEQGKLADAEAMFRKVLASRRTVLGASHPDTLETMNGLGLTLRDEGRLKDAEPLLREAYEGRKRVLGAKDIKTLGSLNNLALVLQDEGKLDEAEKYFREAVQTAMATLGENANETLFMLNNMGMVLQQEGKLAEAETWSRNALRVARRQLGEEHPNTLEVLVNLGGLLLREGKTAEADPILRSGLEKDRRIQGEAHPDTLLAVILVGRLDVAEGRYAEAQDLLAPREPTMRATFTGDDIRRVAIFLSQLGRARVGLQAWPQAERDLLEAQPILVRTRGPRHYDTVECMQGLVDLYKGWNRKEPGKGYDAKARDWAARLAAASAKG